MLTKINKIILAHKLHDNFCHDRHLSLFITKAKFFKTILILNHNKYFFLDNTLQCNYIK